MIGHGFGTPALSAALATLQNVLTEMMKYMEKAFPNVTPHSTSGTKIDSNSNKTNGEKAEDQQQPRKEVV